MSTTSCSSRERARWRSIDALLHRQGRFVGPDFTPGDELASALRERARILVIGAGGLGCELLKGLGTRFRSANARAKRGRL